MKMKMKIIMNNENKKKLYVANSYMNDYGFEL